MSGFVADDEAISISGYRAISSGNEEWGKGGGTSYSQMGVTVDRMEWRWES